MFNDKRIDKLEQELQDMQGYRRECESRHDRSDDRHKRLEDKILLQAEDIAQIRTNTDALVQGDLIKRAGKQFVLEAAKMLTAVSVIVVFAYNGFEVLARGLAVYLGLS